MRETMVLLCMCFVHFGGQLKLLKTKQASASFPCLTHTLKTTVIH